MLLNAAQEMIAISTNTNYVDTHTHAEVQTDLQYG
jgi:hypothetical protein